MVKGRFHLALKIAASQVLEGGFRFKASGCGKSVEPAFSTGDVTDFFSIDDFEYGDAGVIARRLQPFDHIRRNVKSSRFQNERRNS